MYYPACPNFASPKFDSEEMYMKCRHLLRASAVATLPPRPPGPGEAESPQAAPPLTPWAYSPPQATAPARAAPAAGDGLQAPAFLHAPGIPQLWIPRSSLWTRLMINGTIYTAEDCGGGVNGNHIDIFYSTHEEAAFTEPSSRGLSDSAGGCSGCCSFPSFIRNPAGRACLSPFPRR